MKMKSRKGLSILLAFVLIFAMSATPAFADWPSFQSNRWNNGIITNGTPPTSQPELVNTVGLSTNNPHGNVYSGIDNATVMNTASGVTTTYTLYNGGVRNGNLGGARLAITDVASGSVRNIMVDPDANNVAQLSTPYLNTDTNNLYAATTRYLDRLNNGTTSIATGTHTITANVNIPSDYWEPMITFTFPDFVNAADFSASATLGGAYTFSYGYFNTMDGGTSYTIYYDGAQMLPAGNYTLTITTNNSSGSTITASNISFLVSAWKLWEINLSSATPTVTQIGNGYGQANTHIDYYANANFIFFGIYEGDRSYYCYNQATSALTRFNAQDDFYWAGAYQQRLTSSGQVFFGSDSGKLYIQDPTNFSATGTVIDLTTYEADAGRVRSTVMAPEAGNGYAYFTSSGTGARGYLWRMELSTVTSGSPVLERLPIEYAPYSVTSTSTPVLSENDILYIGINAYNTSTFTSVGAVQAFDAATFSFIDNVYEGDPVQASPIVYSDTVGDIDYIYFTTNSAQGAGFCYSYDDFGTINQEWTAGGTSNNRYSVQGFSSDNGYLVYGDDGNNLYIIH